MNKCIIYYEDSRARSAHYKRSSERKGKIHVFGKSYDTPEGSNEKKKSGGDTLTSVRFFKCDEYGYCAPRCNSMIVNYFKC